MSRYEKLIDKKDIHLKVVETSQSVDEYIYKKELEGNNVVILSLANGGLWFTHEVMSQLTRDYIPVLYARLKSYSNEQQGTVLEKEFPTKEQIEGKCVVVIDDIIDSASTMWYTIYRLQERGAEDIQVCTLTMREGYEGDPLPMLNEPFVVEKGLWLVGCGMDASNGGCRYQPYISYKNV